MAVLLKEFVTDLFKLNFALLITIIQKQSCVEPLSAESIRHEISATPRTSATPSVASALSDSLSPPPVQGEIQIPNHWRPEVDECLAEKSLSDSARHEIVRTLVNLLFARTTKPTRHDCEHLARKLIMKHPFLKDDLGNGYVSPLIFLSRIHKGHFKINFPPKFNT